MSMRSKLVLKVANFLCTLVLNPDEADRSCAIAVMIDLRRDDWVVNRQ